MLYCAPMMGECRYPDRIRGLNICHIRICCLQCDTEFLLNGLPISYKIILPLHVLSPNMHSLSERKDISQLRGNRDNDHLHLPLHARKLLE